MKNIDKLFMVGFALVLFFVSVGLPVTAQSEPEDGAIYLNDEQSPTEGNNTNAAVPGGPGFIMIHPSAFFPEGVTGDRALGWGGFLYNPGTSPTTYWAALNLPHQAVITKIVVYYLDNEVNPMNLEVFFQRSGLDDNSFQSLVSFGSFDYFGTDPNPRVMEKPPLNSVVVDNQSHAYWINTHIPGGQGINLRLRGVRIDYSYPVNLPLITN
jgi:hypothetical protein